MLPGRPRDSFKFGVMLGLGWAALTRPLELLACLGCLLLLAVIISLVAVAAVVSLFEWWLVPIGLVVLVVILVGEQMKIERARCRESSNGARTGPARRSYDRSRAGSRRTRGGR